MDTERLSQWFTVFADVECAHLPLYRSMSNGIAADTDLLHLLGTASPGQWRPVLLFAALHDLVLQHPSEPLSRYYPTVGGSFRENTDPMPALRQFVETHAAELSEMIATRATQTNEVNRSCLWFVALRAATVDEPDRPVTLIELGASAGLNLGFDRYHYDFGDGADRGVHDSPVRLKCDLGPGNPPLDATLPPIADRVGIDLAPIDLGDPAQRRWLKACIWPEQPIRHARFDAAAALTLADPPRIVADDAADGLSDLIEDVPDEHHIVVINSWVLTYLHRQRRSAIDSILDLAGSSRCITHISAEGKGVSEWIPEADGHDEFHTVVGMRRWRNGLRTEEHAAHCQAHLQWLDWYGLA